MTIRELAKLTNTSYSTVSRALNDNPKVARETKERIKNVAEQAGYQINASAQSLATGIHRTIGILYPYHSLRAVESIYTVNLMQMLRGELAIQGFDTLIQGYDTIGEDVFHLTRLVRQKKVDALLIIGYEITEEAVIEVAKYTDKFILINPIHDAWVERYDRIMIDHHYGGELAAEVLVAKGRKTLIAIAENSPQFQERIKGFTTIVHIYPGISFSRLVLPSGTFSGAYKFVESHLEELQEADGLFIQSDNSAFGVMNGLLDHGVKIPYDISIVGYDDVDWCDYSRPALSTIHQPKTNVVEAAAQTITSWVLHGKNGSFRGTFKPSFIERKSC